MHRESRHEIHARSSSADGTAAGLVAAILLVAFLLFPLTAAAADGVYLTFELADRIRISERTNLSRSEGGRYVGLMNRQVTGYLTRHLPNTQFAGRMLVYEETLRDMSQIGRPVDDSFDVTLSVDQYRAFTETDRVPAYLGIPALPDGPVAVGDSWSAPGSLIIALPNGADPVTAEVAVSYEYVGTDLFDGQMVHRIEAAFAVRYPPPPNPEEDQSQTAPVRPDIYRISGRHTLTIVLPADSAAPFFIRDEIEEQYDLADHPQTIVRGHSLLFVYGLSAEAQREIAREVANQLEEAETESVAVEQTDAGTRVTIQDIRFVPDQAIILESDRNRLAQIADVLGSIDNVRFLVVGHTADIGSRQSQVDLSWERARVVVSELVSRGLSPQSFDLEGRGGREPVASNEIEEGRAQNRRVEIYILEE